MTDLVSFDPELIEIEEKIIQYLIDSTLFYSTSATFRRILGLFITRKTLTQEMIKKLTGLSAGKVSQELNNLCEKGFITGTQENKTSPIIYTMDSVDIAFVNDAIRVLNTALDWEPRLNQINEDLQKNRNKLEKLNGYEDITRFLNFMMPLMAYTKGAMEEIKQLREEFRKKK